MKFTASLAAELARLTVALDEPGSDIGQGLQQLAATAAGAAVSSYLGLSVIVARGDSSFTLALLEDGGNRRRCRHLHRAGATGAW